MGARTGRAGSRLDRAGLERLARAGGGQYFELDRDDDRRIATAIVDAGLRLAPSLGSTEQFEDLHWRVLALAAVVAALGSLFLRERQEAWLQVLGALAMLAVALTVLR